MSEPSLLFILLTVINWALVLWVKAKIEGTVSHKFSVELENFKYELRQREQAAKIAELLAEWDSKSNETKKLNQLILEANLWLPEEIARELNRVLTYDEHGGTPRELVITIRHLILGETDGLKPEEIAYIPQS